VYDHKLTLMFTAQWAHHVASDSCLVPLHDTLPPGTYAYQDEVHESCLSLVRGLEAYGHEIGLHHHPTTARASWDGFSNDPSLIGDDEYLGTMDDLLDYVAAVPAGGASAITAGTTEEYPESSHSLKFMSARGPTEYMDADNRGDLASTPCAWDGEGTDVWRFRMRSLSLEAIDELQLAHVDLADGATRYTAGFVTHAKDAAAPDPVPFAALFAELHGLGITLQGLSAAAGRYSYTSGDPGTDTTHGCPPDEALEP